MGGIEKQQPSPKYVLEEGCIYIVSECSFISAQHNETRRRCSS